ncbi:prepilin peptidase [Brevibacillus gelatini]
MTTWYVIIPILFVMAVAVYTDLRYRLIYDWLTLPGIAYFLIAHAVLRPDNWAAHVLGVVVLGGLSLGMAVVSNGQLGGWRHQAVCGGRGRAGLAGGTSCNGACLSAGRNHHASCVACLQAVAEGVV